MFRPETGPRATTLLFPIIDDGLDRFLPLTLSNSLVYRAGHIPAEISRAPARHQSKGSTAKDGHRPDGLQFTGVPAPGEQPRQFLLKGFSNSSDITARHSDPFQHQLLDVHVDLHATAPSCGACQRKSISLIGRSSLRNSARDASSTIGMVTVPPLRAAMNAAFRAML